MANADEHDERSLLYPSANDDVSDVDLETTPEGVADASEKDFAGNSKVSLTSLIASKINELEKENTKDEEEEREIARAVKAEHRKLSTLVSETDTEIGKVTLLQRKYTLLFQDMQRLERDHARQKFKSEKSIKDLSAVKTELSRATNMKHKLETLCRELQKENKRVKDDSKRLAQSEQLKRVELNNKFETTIFEIKSKMDEDSEGLGKRRFHESDLKDKFKSFLEQYEIREQYFYSTLRAKELEIQLHQAKAEQLRKSSDLNEQRAKTLHSQVSTFGETESELRSQLNIYVEKFKQVEDTLNNSNDLFLNFRKEMESTTRKTKKLEKENALIRTKCDTANKSILEMAEERAKHRKEIDTLKQKADKLENLCRALQTERSSANSSKNIHPRTNGTGPHASDHPAEDSRSGVLPVHAAGTTLDQSSLDSGEDNLSEASFEIQDEVEHDLPGEQHNPIVGFLKVTTEEELLIREKRLEYGQPTHADPDRDADGYLAVSILEKEFVGALRDSKTHRYGLERPKISLQL